MTRNTDKGRQFDENFGTAIRNRRLALGLTRSQVADKLGITHQQLSKNELGTNRFAINRIPDLARILKVDIDFLFGIKETQPNDRDRLILETSKRFSGLSPAMQKAVNLLIRNLTEAE